MTAVGRRTLLGLAAAGLLAGPAGADAAPREIAVLQGLDKVTARTSTFEAALNQPVRFGSLSITLRHCNRAPPTEPPEATAFLEIVDTPPGEEPRWAFSGWMFKSSPAVSAMEHPVYDVRVLDCVDPAGVEETGAER